MRNFIPLVLITSLLFACKKKDNDQTYLSSYMINKNGQTVAPNYSLIQIRNDSLFFVDLYDTSEGKFIGKISGDQKKFIHNELTFKLSDEKLIIANEDTRSVYKAVNDNDINSLAKINASYFEGKKFEMISEAKKDTIIFINANNYKSLSNNHTNRWSFDEFENIKILWVYYNHEEVPLVIESFDNNCVTAHLYAIDTEKIQLKALY